MSVRISTVITDRKAQESVVVFTNGESVHVPLVKDVPGPTGPQGPPGPPGPRSFIDRAYLRADQHLIICVRDDLASQVRELDAGAVPASWLRI